MRSTPTSNHRAPRVATWPIVAAGFVLGILLAFAAFVVPRIAPRWLFVLTLEAIPGLMMIAAPAVEPLVICSFDSAGLDDGLAASFDRVECPRAGSDGHSNRTVGAAGGAALPIAWARPGRRAARETIGLNHLTCVAFL